MKLTDEMITEEKFNRMESGIEFTFRDGAEFARDFYESINFRWMSISDNLPEIDSIVLICHNDYITISKFGPKKGCVESYFWDEEGRYVFDGVTHWMPLPRLPSN